MSTTHDSHPGPVEVEQPYLREIVKAAIRVYKVEPFTAVLIQMVDDFMLYVQYNSKKQKEYVAFPEGASVEGEVWEPSGDEIRS